MIYVSDAPLGLLSYHFTRMKGKNPICVRDAKEVDLISCISTPGSITDIDELPEALYLIEYKLSSVPSLDAHVHFNTTYICVPEISDKWKGVERLTISPSLYKGDLEAIRAIFTEDGYEYFWNALCLKRFKGSPRKWNMELNSLMIEFRHKRERISSDYLREKYEGVSGATLSTFLINMGTRKGSEILSGLSSSDLWTLFIGSGEKPPFIYHYLVERNNAPEIYCCVSLMREAVIDGLIDLRIGSILFNEWLIECQLIRKFKLIELKEAKFDKFRKLYV